jgi:hypothetical protein
MRKLNPGDLAFATWMDDGFIYPCVVVNIEDELVHVAYLDGDETNIPMDQIYETDIKPGMNVSVNFKGRGNYYAGRVLSCIGMAVEIQYEDGDYGWTSIAQCRVSLSHLSRAYISPSAN